MYNRVTDLEGHRMTGFSSGSSGGHPGCYAGNRWWNPRGTQWERAKEPCCTQVRLLQPAASGLSRRRRPMLDSCCWMAPGPEWWHARAVSGAERRGNAGRSVWIVYPGPGVMQARMYYISKRGTWRTKLLRVSQVVWDSRVFQQSNYVTWTVFCQRKVKGRAL